ncbi:MAG: hypothetical protein QXL51_00070 [Candidatus Aenigmatarchaeota archaeon]
MIPHLARPGFFKEIVEKKVKFSGLKEKIYLEFEKLKREFEELKEIEVGGQNEKLKNSSIDSKVGR